MSDLSDAIETAASAPKEATVASRSATAHPLLDQIAADQYLAARNAASKKTRGLRFNKILKGGQTGLVDDGDVT